MSTNGLTLVDLPKSLMRPDLERRLPTGNAFKNRTGWRGKHYEVIGLAGFLKDYSTWLCRCDCGKPFMVRNTELHDYGDRTSCGCMNIYECHGMSLTAEYQIFKGIMSRCDNKSHTSYRNYGGRGITVCERWRNSFMAFYEDMGPRPSSKHSVDRYPNRDGNYEPDNCRWATAKEQIWNSSIPRMVPFNGVTQPLSAWAEPLGITRERMRQRVNKCLLHGVDIAEALTTPAGETMPWFRDQYERYRLRIAERNASMVKDEWFDGKVHVLQQGKHWSNKIHCETFRSIIQAEAEARGGKCKFRILNDHVMFVFESKKVAAA